MAQVLILGKGAREHALAQTFIASPQVDQVYVAPGNSGMETKGIQILSDIELDDFAAMLAFAKEKAIDLTFVGSEEPLIGGVVDIFQEAGLKIFGPSQAAAQLEGSKDFAKSIMAAAKVPTAHHRTVTSLPEAQAFLTQASWPLVFKIDGLAAGKGVSIIAEEEQARNYLLEVYRTNPAQKLVIEEFLQGPEFSIFSFVGPDGQIQHVPLAQDHKRRFDGDRGPNTGGMGAYSPLPWLNEKDKNRAIQELVLPVLAEMNKQGMPFTGVLYTGVILTKAGPKVIEFNVRLGDPEAQVVLPQLQSDFYQNICDLLAGRPANFIWQKEAYYLGVVLVSPAYPAKSEEKLPVPYYKDLAPLIVNYATVEKDGEQLVSDGGRILTVVGHEANLQAARDEVYRTILANNTALAYRKDIGHAAL
ncbi:phosphoribosylamine--glycine ligase [Eupransor demetentiae]|uniref:Phosphoribosylamine--glycine ligase n=1 Tax=Eupransor demetentiae TaxID=3109584 RepID=A0ABM9N457_9LACO|nr:Phosphoribosylamine-glycine ligase (PurD) [Lactobacillaceae bacterium LMG 33000]